MHAESRYALVGASVLTLLTGMVITILWLSVGLSDKSYRTYAVYINEPVSGLTSQAPVKFNGVEVGYVKHIDINLLNPQQVFLLLAVEKDTPVTVSTFALLQSQGITGVRYIELQASTPTNQPLRKKSGQPFPVIPAHPSLLAKLTKGVTRILDKDNVLAIKHILHNVSKASRLLPGLLAHWTQTSRDIDHMVSKVGQAGISLKHAMDTGQQLLESLNDQSVPQFTETVGSFKDAGKNISQLASELKRDPSMLIKGRAPRKLGPGEKQCSR